MMQVLPGNSAKVVNVNSWKTYLVAVLVLMLFLSGKESAYATAGGSPYDVPVVTDTNPDPNIVETTIEANEATVDIGNGVMAKVVTYNGTIPGPQFRLKVGDTVIVHFKNKLKQETGIHWHGVELNNASDGTPLTQQQVKPGQKFDYKFIVPRPGIFWYHPHHHSSTDQVFRGLYGSLIVADPLEAALQGGVLPSAAQTKTLVLSDITVCKAQGSNDTATYDSNLPHVSGIFSSTLHKAPSPYDLCEGFPIDEDGNPMKFAYKAGDVPNIMNTTPGPVGEGQTVLTNGVNVGARAGTPTAPGALAAGASTLNVQPGQGLRLQIINASATRYVRLLLTNSAGGKIDLVRIGGQGGLLDEARLEGGQFNYNSGEILIPPGSREDVVAVIPNTTGVLTLWTEDYERTGAGYAWIPTVPVMHLNVTGESAPQYTISAGTLLRQAGAPVEDLSTKAVDPLLPPPDGLPGIGPDVTTGVSPDITFTNSVGGATGLLGVNEIQGDHDHASRPASTRYAQIGDTLELKVTNKTGAHHPFHLHGFSVQPITLSKGITVYSYPYREFRDEIDIPSGYTLTFRVRLDERPNFYDDKGKVLAVATPTGGGLGRWLFHCHVLFHATLGMISELDVVAPNSQN